MCSDKEILSCLYAAQLPKLITIFWTWSSENFSYRYLIIAKFLKLDGKLQTFILHLHEWSMKNTYFLTPGTVIYVSFKHLFEQKQAQWVRYSGLDPDTGCSGCSSTTCKVIHHIFYVTCFFLPHILSSWPLAASTLQHIQRPSVSEGWGIPPPEHTHPQRSPAFWEVMSEVTEGGKAECLGVSVCQREGRASFVLYKYRPVATTIRAWGHFG